MTFPALQEYLSRLHVTPQADTALWLDESGAAKRRAECERHFQTT